jgi:hypothetical protein
MSLAFLGSNNKSNKKAASRRNQRVLGLLFDPDDGGGMYLRNISWLSRNYAECYPTR